MLPRFKRIPKILCLCVAMAWSGWWWCGPHEAGGESIAPPPHAPAARVEFLGAIKLDNLRVGRRALRELSGLAWSEDDSLLYALSDRGYVVQLRPEFDRAGLLQGATAAALFPLLDRHGRVLAGAEADSEGLEILRGGDDGRPGNSVLAVSFEHRPRVCRYRPDGTWLGCETLPGTLADPGSYAAPNKGLEALALVPGHGLLTGAERPRAGEAAGRFTVHSAAGDSWSFPLHDPEHGALVGLTALPGNGNNGRLLALERSPWRPLRGFRAAVHLLRLDGVQATSELLPVPALPGENFEGISARNDGVFCLVSDDDGQPFLDTLLYCFRLRPAAVDEE